MRKRVGAVYADVAIGVEEVAIEADLALVLGFASKAVSQARRTFLLLGNEEGLFALFTSNVSDTHAGQAGRNQLIA